MSKRLAQNELRIAMAQSDDALREAHLNMVAIYMVQAYLLGQL